MLVLAEPTGFVIAAPAAAAPICVIDRPERGNEHTGVTCSAMPKHVPITSVNALVGYLSISVISNNFGHNNMSWFVTKFMRRITGSCIS